MLDQSELRGGSVAEASKHLQVQPGHGGKHSLHPSAKGSRSFVAAPSQRQANTCSLPAWSWRQALSPPQCKRQTRAPTSRSPTAVLVEQVQAPLWLRRRGKQTPAGAAWSWRQALSPSECLRQRRAPTSSPPPPCIYVVEQVQACSTSRSFVAAPSQRQANEPAGAGWSVMAASTLLRPSAKGRDEHAPP